MKRIESRALPLLGFVAMFMMATSSGTIAVSTCFHRSAGWPYGAIYALVGFAVLSSFTIAVLFGFRGRTASGGPGGLALLVGGTGSLWTALLLDAHRRIAFPMPCSIGCALFLAVCWVYWAYSFRRVARSRR